MSLNIIRYIHQRPYFLQTVLDPTYKLNIL